MNFYKKPPEDYTNRIQFYVIINDGSSNFEVYTDSNLSIDEIKHTLVNRLLENNKEIKTIKITHTATKEQDDRIAEFIDGFLNENE